MDRPFRGKDNRLLVRACEKLQQLLARGDLLSDESVLGYTAGLTTLSVVSPSVTTLPLWLLACDPLLSGAYGGVPSYRHKKAGAQDGQRRGIVDFEQAAGEHGYCASTLYVGAL